MSKLALVVSVALSGGQMSRDNSPLDINGGMTHTQNSGGGLMKAANRGLNNLV